MDWTLEVVVLAAGQAAGDELVGRGVECRELQVFAPEDGGRFGA